MKKYRIVGTQPVGKCSCCGATGGYWWAGKEHCYRHCSEFARARTIMRRGVTAIEQALGESYKVRLQVQDLSTGNWL